MAGIVGGNLFVAGGFNSKSEPTEIVEKYDMEKRKWIRMPSFECVAGGVLFGIERDA